MRPYQDAEGRIIDPVEKTEKYYTTPCFAHSVAVLAKAGYPIEKDLLESGMKALDVSLADLAAAKAPGGHGDFFTWPIVFAIELFDGTASKKRKASWNRELAAIDPARAYRAYRKPRDPSDHQGFYDAYGPHYANNWNLVNTAGEWGRVQHGAGDLVYVDNCLTMQLANFSPHGMYNEGGNPLPYDLFSRHYLTGMLQRGYRSHVYLTYRDILWRGAWTSLFMQSPFGELPTGYRSSHHIWNEAEQAVIFEIYASACAKAGRMAEAGAFKRAARLSLASVRNWLRPDGSGYIVKNRFPVEARHGYETYSVHTCYNMLAMSMLAQAWHSLAAGRDTPKVETLEETPARVRFRVTYPDVTQTITVDRDGATVEDLVTADGIDAMRVSFPMLVSDGENRTDVKLQGNAVTLSLGAKSVKFTVLEPKGVELQRSGKELRHRNGLVEAVVGESNRKRMVYRISAGGK